MTNSRFERPNHVVERVGGQCLAVLPPVVGRDRHPERVGHVLLRDAEQSALRAHLRGPEDPSLHVETVAYPPGFFPEILVDERIERAEDQGMSTNHNTYGDLHPAAHGRVANRYAASGTYRATRAEREALLEAAHRAAEKMEAESGDVRPVDPFTDAVAGICCFALIGGLFVCGVWAVARWIVGVVS